MSSQHRKKHPIKVIKKRSRAAIRAVPIVLNAPLRSDVEINVADDSGKLLIKVSDNVEEKYKQDRPNESTGKASLKATQPFEIDGQNVTIKGQAQIEIEGSATVTLKCGGSQIQLSSAGIQISGPMITLG